MVRSRRPGAVLVPIGLTVSDADAARIDQVLARPEYTGWTRDEWCREIVRSALRYYVGDEPAPDPGEARLTADKPVSAGPAATGPDRALAPVVSRADQAVPPGSEPAPATPESLTGSACPHPADARDYESGTCAACGAILWD